MDKWETLRMVVQENKERTFSADMQETMKDKPDKKRQDALKASYQAFDTIAKSMDEIDEYAEGEEQ
ncbi:hypothetical protein [Salibacterium lacus]|uniref:Transcriptional regulator n=1 Tax=Salibacterium lacus TaxID=1898109 RepID=A0ABW5SYN5_9BACI